MSDWINPKENWNNNDAPVGSDFNRIEIDNRVNHELVLQEIADRTDAIAIEVSARTDAIAIEKDARVSADNTLQSNINTITNGIGNASGNIPINNGTLCTNLNSNYVNKQADTNVYGEGLRGVYGKSHEINGFGVFGVADNTSGSGVPVGVYGSGMVATGGIGVFGGGASIGVEGNGGVWDFYAVGAGGNYGPFTGAHEATIKGVIPEIGMIVSTTGIIKKREGTISATIPEIEICSIENDKKVFGVYSGSFIIGNGFEHWSKNKNEVKELSVCNAIGDGQVLVSNINGNIECGDYITTSAIPGYGMKQNDDTIHSYTLGKCTETIDWDKIQVVDGIKKCLIACTYFSA